MATWDNLTDTTARLTLDPSDTGPFYRTKTHAGLEANQLYTFYVTTDTTTPQVQPLLEVVGGDLAIAEEAGEHTILARGETNGSGEITTRIGVLTAEDAPTSESSDDLDYATQAAAEAAGWTVTDTMTSGSITFDSNHAIAGSGLATSILYGVNGIPNAGELKLAKTFNVGAGTVVRGKLWAEGHGSRWEFLSLQITNTAGTSKAAHCDGNDGVEHLDTGPLTAGGDGLIAVTIRLACFPSNHNQHTYHFAGFELAGAGGAAVIDFSDVGPCFGTGTSETGGPEMAVAA